jgi:AraC-type DNA-binding domain-containing proteins
LKEQELENYLRTPSYIELFYLNSNSNDIKVGIEEERSKSEMQDLKIHPASREDIALFDKNFSDSIRTLESQLIPPDKNISFYMHPRYSPPHMHRHSFIEMSYVYSGKCNQVINNNKIIMQKGEICILDTNTAHAIEQADENDIIINCLMRKSYFDAAFMSRLSGNDIFTNFFIHAIYQSKDFNEYILLHSGENEEIHDLMSKILCEYLDKKFCSDEVIDSYMIILFAEMLRVYKSDISNIRSYTIKNIEFSKIVKYIQNNYKTVTLESTAKHFNFNTVYLSKTLKKLTGHKFIDLVHQIRLNQACLFLKNTDTPINAISNEIGYENTNFFYSIFKRHFNCSPAEYRENFK